MDEKKSTIVKTSGKTTCACGDGCNCGCGYGHERHIIWWILGIILLLIVFAVGVKVGEFRVEIRNDMYGQGYYHGYPMMQGSAGYNPGGIPPAPTEGYPSSNTPVPTGTPTGL